MQTRKFEFTTTVEQVSWGEYFVSHVPVTMIIFKGIQNVQTNHSSTEVCKNVHYTALRL
jgi:hypothetical protein